MQYGSMPESLKKGAVLLEIFNAALSAVHPCDAVMRTLRRENNKLHVAGMDYALDSFNRVLVVGAGKATAHMAAAVEEVLSDVIDTGAILVKYGHRAALRTIEQIEAAGPIPDEAGMQGTQKILDMFSGVDAKTFVICLLSGGGSALLVNPLPGISLDDKQKTIDLLLRAGASVYERSTVCKHLSGVKGGRLARAAYPATVMTLTLSDVIGDRIDVIGSGPTAPGNSTFCEAAHIIEKFELRYKLPEEVVALIDRGTRGEEPETAKSAEACFRRTRNIIVGGIAQALFSAGNKAKTSGYVTDLVINEKPGPVHQAAGALAKRALRARDSLNPGERRCLLSAAQSPETKKNGSGGRNQELALAFAQEISGIPGITLLSACTRGTDGVTDASGAIVDGTTIWRARAAGIYGQRYLDNNDAYAFFRRFDSLYGLKRHVRTGPTGAEGIDMQMILIEDDSRGARGLGSGSAAMGRSRAPEEVRNKLRRHAIGSFEESI